MNTEILKQHLAQLQHTFKCINELWEVYNTHGDYVDDVLNEDYPFNEEFQELSVKVNEWTKKAIEKL